MTFRRIVTVVFCATIITAALGACTAAPGPTVSLSAEHFWSGFGVVSEAEADPAENLKELVSRSTLIVTGSIADLTDGPTDIYELNDGEISAPSTILTLEVSKIIAGTVEGDVRIWLSRENPSVSGVEMLPSAEFLWFLRPSDASGLFHTTTLAGVIGANSAGKLVAFRDPSTGESIIPTGVHDLRELEGLAVDAHQ